MNEWALAILRDSSLIFLGLLFLIENLLIFLMALIAGKILLQWYAKRRVCIEPAAIERREVVLAISTIFFNTAITIFGLWLWRIGIIQFRVDIGWWAWLDIIVLIIVMDFAMYFLHRIAHWPIFFPILHRTHHIYENPRPLSLFVLNPIEALSFGGLWLVVISVYHASWFGMSTYLMLNVVFGTIGHLGVEPCPDRWKDLPIIKFISTSTFHAQHHRDLKHNYGFYTLLWDRLFGTLSPKYRNEFGHLPE